MTSRQGKMGKIINDDLTTGNQPAAPDGRTAVVARKEPGRKAALIKICAGLLGRDKELRSTLADNISGIGNLNVNVTEQAMLSDSVDIAASVLEHESRELQQIQKAMTRLRDGIYGLCEICTGQIPTKRLQALPYSTTCINCQRDHERCSQKPDSKPDWSSVERLRVTEHDMEPAILKIDATSR